MTDGFDFIAAYRDLDAAAPRDVVEARQKSHDKLWSAIKNMGQIYDLCRLAFLLDPPPASDWFEEPMREFDPHFVLKKDTVDAGRMAALLLRQHMEQKGSYTPLTALAASFCGKRHSVDDDLLTKRAAEKFAAAVRDHRVTDGAKLAAAPKLTAIKVELDALAAQNPVTGTVAKDAVAASMTSAETAIGALSDNVEKPLAATRGDVARLAEEVDMLWWHIGDWHELLGKPRSDTPTEAKMIVSGIELGTMVRQLPGPYGANGILRRISAADADAKTTLRAAVKSLSQGDAQKLSANVPASSQSLFPIHAAIGMAAGGAAWEAELSRVVPEIAGTETAAGSRRRQRNLARVRQAPFLRSAEFRALFAVGTSDEPTRCRSRTSVSIWSMRMLLFISASRRRRRSELMNAGAKPRRKRNRGRCRRSRSGPVTRCRWPTCPRSQAARDGRLAMDEFSTGFCRVSEVG